MTKPAFLITIDTEGDNLWQNHRKITTDNTRFLPRFQALCEKYQFKPTWLTNYEMASDLAYVEFASDVVTRNQGEVGMHLHAWNSPPEQPLTEDDWKWQPYLIEYPDDLLKAKVRFMTELLENSFGTPMRSHRAGRWAFDERYAAILLELGYCVDCSVTPRVNWRFNQGAPQGNGGTDYTHFPRQAYFIDAEDISRPASRGLLEVPMSTDNKHSPLVTCLKQGIDKLRGRQRAPSVYWLRPSRDNLSAMKRVVEKNLATGGDYVEFMLHSSEFMPGGSPTFKTAADIETLYENLEQLFEWLSPRTRGMTLFEYYQYYVERHAPVS